MSVRAKRLTFRKLSLPSLSGIVSETFKVLLYGDAVDCPREFNYEYIYLLLDLQRVDYFGFFKINSHQCF